MANIMIQGTTSSAGKSMICTGLCRIFKQDGYKVYPFKSQNMSSKYYLSEEGYKISTAQAMQAYACGLEPDPGMNPILLVPKTDMGSMVVIEGKDSEHMEAQEYFKYKNKLKPMILESYKKIESENDIIVIEGAGSPAEINLKENDIVNMGMAEMADADVLIVADIDRGGVFASFYGTVMLLEPEERKRVKGLIINKFRGDKTILDPGIEMIEEILGIPVVGTIPYAELDFPEEDSLISLDGKEKNNSDINKISHNFEKELDKWGDILRANMDMEYIYKLIFKG